ncbi:MAG: phosphate acyltransferase PlsX [Clostridiales bacterium]|nr:phosphate acyltransferase PlsX [Clostridiales bacterium]
MKLVIDAFGGDNAPQAVIEGTAKALADWDDFDIIFTGDEQKIRTELEKNGIAGSDRVTVIHAPDVITCDEQPTIAVKRKKNSSLVAAMNVMAAHEADCLISAGSTGAVLTGATLIVRRIPGVKRPALAPVMPTAVKPFLLVDCGANSDCKPEYLQQFAVMGSAYMQGVMGIESPAVGLVNNGEEEAKGSELTKASHALLKNTDINFAGNCEGREIFSGKYDVIVTDGFTGNIILKEAEGLAETLFRMIKREIYSSLRTKVGAALAKPAFKAVKKTMDYTEYGGAPLLGINGGIIKAHGSSDAKAFVSAIRQARLYVSGGVTEKIAAGIGSIQEAESND